MTVLVVGAGGYLGRHLVQRLRALEVAVRAASSRDGTGLDPVSGRPSEAFRIASDVDVVVYLAQSPYYRQVPERIAHVLSVNVCSAVAVAERARRAGARRLIHLSTGAVYRPSFTPLGEDAELRRNAWYPLTKLHAEEQLAMFRDDLEVVVLRPFTIYGPAQDGKLVPKLVEAVAHDREVVLEPRCEGVRDDGGLRVSLCYVDDVVETIVHSIRGAPPDVLNVAGREALSIREIAAAIGSRIGRTPRYVAADSSREGDLVADIARLDRWLAPRLTPFAEGLERTLEGCGLARGKR